jgi:hypothetical protein
VATAAMGGTVISAENDSNDSKAIGKSLRNDSQ